MDAPSDRPWKRAALLCGFTLGDDDKVAFGRMVRAWAEAVTGRRYGAAPTRFYVALERSHDLRGRVLYWWAKRHGEEV